MNKLILNGLAVIYLLFLNSCHSNDGYLSEYYDDGTLKVKVQVKPNGEYHGLYTSYYPNGVLEDSSWFENDKRNGFSFLYHSSGAIAYKGTMKNDELHGKGIYYYETGELEADLTFYEGNKAGKCIWYFKSGKIELIKNYNKNKVEAQYYYSTGNLRKKEFLVDEKGMGIYTFDSLTNKLITENHAIELSALKNKQISIKVLGIDTSITNLITMDLTLADETGKEFKLPQKSYDSEGENLKVSFSLPIEFNCKTMYIDYSMFYISDKVMIPQVGKLKCGLNGEGRDEDSIVKELIQ